MNIRWLVGDRLQQPSDCVGIRGQVLTRIISYAVADVFVCTRVEREKFLHKFWCRFVFFFLQKEYKQQAYTHQAQSCRCSRHQTCAEFCIHSFALFCMYYAMLYSVRTMCTRIYFSLPLLRSTELYLFPHLNMRELARELREFGCLFSDYCCDEWRIGRPACWLVDRTKTSIILHFLTVCIVCSIHLTVFESFCGFIIIMAGCGV
jgi:hypothetical protein